MKLTSCFQHVLSDELMHYLLNLICKSKNVLITIKISPAYMMNLGLTYFTLTYFLVISDLFCTRNEDKQFQICNDDDALKALSSVQKLFYRMY